MYLPLRFLEQIDNYVNTVERPELRSTINKMSVYAITRIMERKREILYLILTLIIRTILMVMCRLQNNGLKMNGIR